MYFGDGRVEHDAGAEFASPTPFRRERETRLRAASP
jgi:hypothetical protein